MVRIGVTGTHSTGKTTLVNSLHKTLGTNQYVRITEILRELLAKEGYQKVSDTWKDGTWRRFQWTGLMAQINRETEAGVNFVSDRTVIDSLSYFEHLVERLGFEEGDPADYRKAVVKHLRSQPYDFIIYVPPVIPLVDDGFRNFKEGIEFRTEIDARIRGIIEELELDVHCLQSRTPKGRVDEVMRLVQAWEERE